MAQGLIDQKDKFKKRIASADISKYRKVYKNELVVGFPIDEGVLGFQFKHPFAAVSPAYTVWRLKKQYLDTVDNLDLHLRFLDMLLRSPVMREVYRFKLQGAVDRRRTITPNLFLGIKLPIPPKDKQLAIVNKHRKIDEAALEIRNLEREIKDGLNEVWTDKSNSTGLSEESFQSLVSKWKKDTQHISSVTKMSQHPAYRQIIAMGFEVLPYLFKELSERPDHWLIALNSITGQDPVATNSTFEQAVEAWLAWGKEQGYLQSWGKEQGYLQ
jgi:hypothetical protein